MRDAAKVSGAITERKREIAYALLVVILVQSAFTASGAHALQHRTQPEGREVTIPAGTEVTVITTEGLYSSTMLEGDPVTFKVADDERGEAHRWN